MEACPSALASAPRAEINHGPRKLVYAARAFYRGPAAAGVCALYGRRRRWKIEKSDDPARVARAPLLAWSGALSLAARRAAEMYFSGARARALSGRSRRPCPGKIESAGFAKKQKRAARVTQNRRPVGWPARAGRATCNFSRIAISQCILFFLM